MRKGCNYHSGEEASVGIALRMEIFDPLAMLFKETNEDVDNNGLVLRL